MTAAESVNEEAVEAAARASLVYWHLATRTQQDAERNAVTRILAAALPLLRPSDVPHLERRIRESIAGEIEEAASTPPAWDVDASWTFERKAVLDHAARIARESSS